MAGVFTGWHMNPIDSEVFCYKHQSLKVIFVLLAGVLPIACKKGGKITAETRGEKASQLCTSDSSDPRCQATKATSGKETLIQDNSTLTYSIIGPGKISNTNSITVAWDDAGATSYIVIFSHEPTCKISVYTFNNVAKNLQIADNLDDGHYYICVMAQKGDQLVAAKNNGYEIYIDRSPPGQFQIVSPIATTNSLTPVISWSNSTGVSTYDLLIGYDADCKSVVQSFTDLTTTSQSTEQLADHSTYYTCIIAKDLAGNRTQVKGSFQLETSSPAPFSISAPLSLGNAHTPTVAWSASLNAVNYDLKVAASSGCVSPVQTFSHLTGLSQALTNLSDGTYYLCLSANNAAGNASFADNTNYPFTIDSIAPTVTFSTSVGSPTNTAPIPVTITFSKNVTGFIAGDINVGNGSVTSLSGSGNTYTANITPSGQGAVTIDVAAGIATDLAGNSNTAASQLSVSYDSIAPSTPTVNGTTPTNSTRPTWSWSRTGVASDTFRYKLDDNNLAVGATSTSSTSFQPASALSSGAHVFYVQEGDLAGNWSGIASLSISIDTIAPTVAITSSTTSYTNASSFNITITFSEAVAGLAIGGVTVSNGSKSNFTAQSSTVYTMTVSPNTEGAVTVDIADGACTDMAGNSNTAATQFSTTYDATKPAAPSVSATTPTNNPSLAHLWTWTSGGGGNGTYRYQIDDTLLSSPTTTTATFLTPPSALSDGSHTLTVEERDDAGNWSDPSTKTVVIDTTPPTVTISTTKPNLTNASPIPFTIKFSESVTGFATGSITATGGTKGSLSGSGTTYSISVTPSGNGTITLLVSANAANDVAGNSSTASSTYSINYDGTAPVAGNSGTLSFSNVTSTGMTVNWTKATDATDAQSTLTYVLYSSTDDSTDSITTLTDIATSNHGIPMGYGQKDINSWAVTNLKSGTTYYFNVVARDAADNRVAYAKNSQGTNGFTSGAGTLGNPYLISNVYELQNMSSNLSAYYRLNNNIDATVTHSWNFGAGFVPIGNATNLPTSEFSGHLDGNGKVITGLYIFRNTTNDVGLFGYVGASGTIQNMGINRGTVTGKNDVGILVGTNKGTISNVSVMGLASGAVDVGSIAGVNSSGTISDSYAVGFVYGGGSDTGGLVGRNTSAGILQRTYYRGNVNQTWYGGIAFSNSGGLVGYNEGATVSNSFALGRVTAGTGGNAGGLIGNNSASSTVTGSYYLNTGSNTSNCVGVDSSGTAVCTSKTDSRWFKSIANAPQSGWTFGAGGNWMLPETGKYPRLQWEQPNAPVSFGEEIINGRKISSNDKAAYHIWGFCSSPDDNIELTATDVNAATVTASVSCLGGRWDFNSLNLSPLAQGNVVVSVAQSIGGNLSAAVTRTLSLDSAFCDGNPSSGSFAGGAGTQGNPYTICTVAQLKQVSNTGYYALKNNLDLSSGYTATIGGWEFGGVFDGNNYILKNNSTPIFAAVNGGTVTNLGVEDTTTSMASFTWTAGGAFSNIHMSGNISSATHFGSLFGGTNGPTSLANVFSTATLMGTYSVGGLSTGSFTSVTNSHFSGEIIDSSYNDFGLVGEVTSTLSDSYMSGDIFSWYGCAGLLRNIVSTATVTNVSNTGNVFCFSDTAGIATTMTTPATMTNANTSGMLVGATVGGFLYSGGGTISDSSSTATISSLGAGAGFIGNVNSTYGSATITNSHFSGTIFGSAVGGFVNSVSSAPVTVQNSYVDASMSGTGVLGGLVGIIGGNGSSSAASGSVIEKSYFTGSIASIDPWGGVLGGIVGRIAFPATIRDVYAIPSLSRTSGYDSYLGGFVGIYDAGAAGSTITRSYVQPSILDDQTGGYAGYAGGFVAFNSSNLAITDSFVVPSYIKMTGSTTYAGLGLASNSATGSITNTYVSTYPSAVSTCIYSDSNSSTTACNLRNDPSYFYTNSNAPMSNWTFPSTWKDSASAGLPILHWQ